MRGTLAVAAREIAERKILFLGAFVTGLLPLGFPLIPALRGNSRDARSVAVLLGAAIVAVALSLAFGATVLVGDIVQKRFSFYLSRPLSSLSIWAGKILAAFSITAACVVLTVAPLFLVEGERAFSMQTGGFGSRGLFVFTFMGVLLLILLSHAVASMARLPSRWTFPDFVLALILAAAIVVSLRSLLLSGFWDRLELGRSEWPLWMMVIPLIAALLVASYVQVADGRIDPRRSHGALSATLWGLLALLALPLAALSWWVDAWSAQDVAAVRGHGAPRGTWLDLIGDLRARGSAGAAFLYDTSSGRLIKRPLSKESAAVAFSADGTRSAWLQEEPGFLEWKRTGLVRIAALDGPGPPTVSDVSTRIWSQLALSPSGRRLAVLDGRDLAVYDVSEPSHPRQLLATRVERTSSRIALVDEDTIRLFPWSLRANRTDQTPRDLEIEEISLPSKKSHVTGLLEPGPIALARMSADARYLVESNEQRLTLHDARTGALLVTLSDDLAAPTMRFLSGNRMVVTGVANGKAVLKIFREGGRTPPFVLELGPAASLVLGGEIVPGRVAISLNPFQRNDERSRRAWKLVFVDVATGATSPGPDGLFPLDRLSWWFSPTLPPAEAGLPSSRLFLDADSRLVRLDPATNTPTVLLGRSK
jgi:hypothetical protein